MTVRMMTMLDRVLGLMVLAVFYGCYFAKMFTQKRNGISTDQIGKGKAGRVWRIEIAMKIATCLAPIVEVASILLGTTALPGPLRVLGFVLGMAGDAVFIASAVTMRDSWRAGVSPTEKTELVTHGIYQWSRNPAFLGFDLVYIGLLMMFFNWPLLIISLLAALTLHLQIVNVEEDFLITAFGADYLAYRRNVRRYLGRR